MNKTLKAKLIRNSISGSLMIILLITLFASCQSNGSTQQPTSETPQVTTMEVDSVLQNAAQLAGSEIEIEGVCTHICKHGGRKIFLMGSNSTRILRIESGKAGKFDPNCVNNIVKVKGVLVEERIDETYLQNWETKLADQTSESHGDGEAGCSTEKRARGESANTPQARIAQFRKRIAEQKAENGKDYLSFYHVEATGYSVGE